MTGPGWTQRTDIVRGVGVRQSGRAQREARVLAAARDLFTAQGYDPLLAKMFGEN